MKRAIQTFLLFLLPLGFVLGAESQNLRDSLAKQAAAWDEAIWKKNETAIVANIGENFRHIDSSGGVNDKQTFVANLLSADLTIDPYTVEDFEIRIYGEIALLSGRTKMTGTYQGKPFKSHYRYVDIYHRENDRWVVINIQITRVSE